MSPPDRLRVASNHWSRKERKHKECTGIINQNDRSALGMIEQTDPGNDDHKKDEYPALPGAMIEAVDRPHEFFAIIFR